MFVEPPTEISVRFEAGKTTATLMEETDNDTVDEQSGSVTAVVLASIADPPTYALGAAGTETATVIVTDNDAGDPRVESFKFKSDPGTDKTYKIGDTVQAEVTFSEAVDVVTTGGKPELALNVGGTERAAEYASGTASDKLVFEYEVEEGHEDTTGIAIGAGKLSREGGTIKKKGGTTDAILGHRAEDADPGHKVDGVRPELIETGDDAPYVSDDGSKVILTFSEDLGRTLLSPPRRDRLRDSPAGSAGFHPRIPSCPCRSGEDAALRRLTDRSAGRSHKAPPPTSPASPIHGVFHPKIDGVRSLHGCTIGYTCLAGDCSRCQDTSIRLSAR